MVIPRSNLQDVLIDEKYESMVEIIAVDSLDEVLEHALVGEQEESLARREARKGHRHLLGHLGLNPRLNPPHSH